MPVVSSPHSGRSPRRAVRRASSATGCMPERIDASSTPRAASASRAQVATTMAAASAVALQRPSPCRGTSLGLRPSSLVMRTPRSWRQSWEAAETVRVRRSDSASSPWPGPWGARPGSSRRRVAGEMSRAVT